MSSPSRALRLASCGGALAAAIAGGACSRGAGSAGDGGANGDAAEGHAATTGATTPVAADVIATLLPFESQLRSAVDLERPPSAETGLGADPWVIRRVSAGWVGILRGRSAVVLLDDSLREIARLPAPRSPTGLAVGPKGDVLVVGELSSSVARYAVQDGRLVALGESRVPGVLGLRDVAVSPSGAVWVVDERDTRALLVRLASGGASVAASLGVGHGATRVLATAKHVVVNAITEHTIVVVETDARGMPSAAPVRLTNDGPLWGFDVLETDRGLMVLAGGVEDHPLDRRDGYFGWIDSFVYAWRVNGAEATKVGAVNVSERGVVTPKAVSIEAVHGDRVDAFVTGYGSATAVHVGVGGSERGSEGEGAIPLVPGVRAMARVGTRRVMADPLLDAWVSLDADGMNVVPVADAGTRADASTRLGEALFFTTLMSPRNTSDGSHSRFTCETCHFEGYVDGRTHHTGRSDVHATTKPLIGLLGNRPYFTRALDPDLSTVSHSEFRVAGAGNPVDPFFDSEPKDAPWLLHLGVNGTLTALELRRSLMRYLMDASHRPNPATIGRASFAPLERRGAALFRDRCESCHAARLDAVEPTSRIPFERWESLLFTDAAPIVWASNGYQKTGVEPYVHESGARTPSLRRLYKKFPYFTNGSGRSLRAVVEAFAVDPPGSRSFHANAPTDAARLGEDEVTALLAFVELL